MSETCRHFGIARQTFYRWQKQFSTSDWKTLTAMAADAAESVSRPEVFSYARASTPRVTREVSPRWWQRGWVVAGLAIANVLLLVSLLGIGISGQRITADITTTTETGSVITTDIQPNPDLRNCREVVTERGGKQHREWICTLSMPDAD